MSKGLKKAMIYVMEKKNRWTKVKEIPVLFYPSEYTQTKNATYAEEKTASKPTINFTGVGLETLDMNLFFDTYESDEDVRIHTRKITDLMASGNGNPPPILKFVWGPINFTCVLETVTKKFTMFRKDGVPVRATLTVKFREYPNDNAPREKPSRQSKTQVTSVKSGDSMWAMSATAYGSPTMWREIAKSNDIANPRLLVPGMEIAIPKYSQRRMDRCL